MFDRFTDHARKLMGVARQEALHLNHGYIGPEHMLLGLLKVPDSVAVCVFRNLDLDPKVVRGRMEAKLERDDATVMLGQLPFTAAGKEVLEAAAREASDLRHHYIGSEHILLGLLSVPGGMAHGVLRDLGLSLSDTREEVAELLGVDLEDLPAPATIALGPEAPGAPIEPEVSAKAAAALERLGELQGAKKTRTPALDAFSHDLLEEARTAQPVVEREAQLEALAATFARLEHPHALLIGDDGVGRDSVVRALAQRLAALSDAPRLRRLDLNQLVAGTRYRGQLEERIQAIGVEARRVGDVILYLPDFSSFLAWPLPEGDDERPFRLFAPFLERSEVRCVGRISRTDYQRLVERDPAVARLFEPIEVGPPSAEVTRLIVEREASRLAKHHHAVISVEAVEAALKAPTLPGVSQPAAALRLLDQTCAELAHGARNDDPPEGEGLQRLVAEHEREKELAVERQDFEAASCHRQARDEARGRLEELRSGPWVEVTPADVQAVVRRRSEMLAGGGAERRQLESVFGVEVSARPAMAVEPGKILVLLPPGAVHMRVFQEAIQPALATLGRQAEILEDPYRVGGSLEPLYRDLQRCELVIADASGRDPGVACAVGLALGCGRRPLLLAHDPGDLPAGLRGLDPVSYDPIDLPSLRAQLTEVVGALLSRRA